MKKIFSLMMCMSLVLFSCAEELEEASDSPKLYAFYNGLGFADIDTEAAALKELGYGGVSTIIGAGYGKLPELVKAYEKVGLQVLSIYLNVNENPLPIAFLEHLKHSGAMAEVTVTKAGPNTVQALRESAEAAQKLGIKVSLYPHAGFSVATVSDAIEMVKAVGHPNLGVSFNLAHFLKVENAEQLEETITMLAPHLFCVNTNGANTQGKNWDDFIKPLGKGDFSQVRLLRALKAVDYKGPFGLQCYGVTENKLQNLSDAMTVWEKAVSASTKTE